MNERETKTRTIVIATLTFASFFVLTSWLLGAVGSQVQSAGDVLLYILCNVFFAVTPLVVVMLAAMWGRSHSIGKIRTIVIAALSATCFVILISWLLEATAGLDTVSEFLLQILRYGCFAVVLFALSVFAIMWDWSVSRGWKVAIAILHILFALAASFCIWIFWLIDWSEVDFSGLAA